MDIKFYLQLSFLFKCSIALNDLNMTVQCSVHNTSNSSVKSLADIIDDLNLFYNYNHHIHRKIVIIMSEEALK